MNGWSMITFNRIKYYIFLLVVITFTGCSSSPNHMPLTDNSSFEQTDYLIGPGDALRIFVWRNADLSSTVTVRPDGRISSPLIDDLTVSGLSPSTVARAIEEVLSTYIRDPKVSVIVSGFNGSAEQQIRIIGNATNPQILPYRSGLTLLDIMISAQGLTEFADGDNAKLIRKEGSVTKTYIIELDSLVKGGDISKNRYVHPGDTIIIPESWF